LQCEWLLLIPSSLFLVHVCINDGFNVGWTSLCSHFRIIFWSVSE
jgi:hypothetical protein